VVGSIVDDVKNLRILNDSGDRVVPTWPMWALLQELGTLTTYTFVANSAPPGAWIAQLREFVTQCKELFSFELLGSRVFTQPGSKAAVERVSRPAPVGSGAPQ